MFLRTLESEWLMLKQHMPITLYGWVLSLLEGGKDAPPKYAKQMLATALREQKSTTYSGRCLKVPTLSALIEGGANAQ